MRHSRLNMKSVSCERFGAMNTTPAIIDFIMSVKSSSLAQLFSAPFIHIRVPLVTLPTPPPEFSVSASPNCCAAGKGPSAPELKTLTTRVRVRTWSMSA